MTNPKNIFRSILIQPFQIPGNSTYYASREGLPKEKRLMNHDNVKQLLEDVDWDLDEGPVAPYGSWAVENREEFSRSPSAKYPLSKGLRERGWEVSVLEGYSRACIGQA